MFGLKQGQRRDVRVQRCDVPERKASNVMTSGRSREVQNQRRDVPESGKNQRRDVPERCKTNVATLISNVATFQRGSKLTS